MFRRLETPADGANLMRKSILLIPVLAAVLLAALSPANATDKNQASQACAKNPNCFAMPGKNGDLHIHVKNGSGVSSEIYCPAQGSCTCLLCSSGKVVPRGPVGGPPKGSAGAAKLASTPTAGSKTDRPLDNTTAAKGNPRIPPKTNDTRAPIGGVFHPKTSGAGTSGPILRTSGNGQPSIKTNGSSAASGPSGGRN
jgi:hypothetical protein